MIAFTSGDTIPLWINKDVTSDAPTVQIKRLSDEYYLDFNDNTFKNSNWITQTKTLIDSDNQWLYNWNTTGLETTKINAIIEYTVNSAINLEELFLNYSSGSTPQQVWEYGNRTLTGTVSADVVSISGDSVAADNLESQFDGTGLLGSFFPSNQLQIAQIATSGSSLNTVAVTGSVVVGNVISGDYTSSHGKNSSAWVIQDDNGELDFRIEFNIGTKGVPTGLTAISFINSSNDYLYAMAWNWDTNQWDTIGIRQGINQPVYSQVTYPLMTNYVGTGPDVGRVLIRGYGTGLTSAEYNLDYMYISYVIVDRLYIHSGVCQSGSTINTIVFDALASSLDGAYDPAMVYIQSGTGAGQTRLIYQYTGLTKTAVVDRDWRIIPDTTSVFQIVADAGREHVNEGLARGATAYTIILNENASNNNDAYIGQVILIRSGYGEDQARRVIAYDGNTKVATIRRAWHEIPDTTSAYVMLPTANMSYGYIAESVWETPAIEYNHVLGSFGNAFSTNINHPINEVAGDVWEQLIENHGTNGSFGKEMSLTKEEAHRARALATNKVTISSIGTGLTKVDTVTIYDDDGFTILYTLTVTGETPTARAVGYEKPF